MIAADQRKSDPKAQAAIARWGELKTIRAFHEPDWEDIASLIRPQRAGFSSSGDRTSRQRREKPLSSEPIMAASSFAAGIYAALTNPANRWGGFETPDLDFNEWRPMAEWLDVVTNRVLASFAPSVSAFYPATYQAYADIAAFGQAAGYDEIDVTNRRFTDVTISLAEIVVDIDAHGRVVEFVRKFPLKPTAAARAYGLDNLPERARKMVEERQTGDIVFYYHVMPNDEFVRGQLGPRGKKWLAVTACEMDETLVRIGGHDDMPSYFPRWDVDSGMTYGTGPGFISLASARMVQRMEDATLRAAQHAADPTKLVPDRQAFPLEGQFRPGGVVYGGVDFQSRPRIHTMNTHPNIGLTHEEKRDKIEAVRAAYHYTLTTVANRTGMTEEETRIMEEARLRNWAPNADRIMEEYAARKFERRFNLLWRAGQLPPPPEEGRGLPLRVRYQSAATMAMKARDAQTLRSFLNDLGPLAQISPRYRDRLDHDATIEALHDASASLPATLLRSRADADQIAKARAEQAEQAQQMEMAQQAGGVVKDLSSVVGQAA